MFSLFEVGAILSKKNLSAWLSLLLLFHLPFLVELYILLSEWPKFWGFYLIMMIASMFFGVLISLKVLRLRLDIARRSYDRGVLMKLLGSYLLPLALLSPGLISFFAGLLLLSPRLVGKVGEFMSCMLAITPQQWYNSILLVHTREQGSNEEQKTSHQLA